MRGELADGSAHTEVHLGQTDFRGSQTTLHTHTHTNVRAHASLAGLHHRVASRELLSRSSLACFCETYFTSLPLWTISIF